MFKRSSSEIKKSDIFSSADLQATNISNYLSILPSGSSNDEESEEEEEELSFVEGAREEEREALPGLRTRAAMLAAVEVAVVLSSRVSFFDSTSALRVFAFARARLSKRGLALFLSASFVLVEPRAHYKRRPAGLLKREMGQEREIVSKKGETKEHIAESSKAR